MPKNIDETLTKILMNDHIIFSKRLAITNEAIEWCEKNNINTNSFNIVTALCLLGYINPHA